MSTDPKLLSVLEHVSFFLNQNDLCTLCQVSKEISERVGVPKLYKRVRITHDPVIRSDKWCIDCGTTYLVGLRQIIKTEDQNAMFLYDRIERLLENEKSKLRSIKEIYIEEGIFRGNTSGRDLLARFVNCLASIGEIEVLDIRDIDLLKSLTASGLFEAPTLKQGQLLDLVSFQQVLRLTQINKLECLIEDPPWKKNICSPELKHFLNDNIKDISLVQRSLDFSSYRLFQYLKTEGFTFYNIENLKIEYVHSPIDFADDSNNIMLHFLVENIDLGKLKSLEMVLCCGQGTSCSCIEDFCLGLAPYLTGIQSLGLIQKCITGKGHHYKNEEWDIATCKFISQLPQVQKNLRKLLVEHDPSFNGLGKDNVDGNYIRRRKLFDTILPQLQSLKTLIIPRIIQSVAPYEIISCDFLWNGCTCPFCLETLPKWDEFLMNHQYFNISENKYKDLIPSQLVSYIGEELYQRCNTNRMGSCLDLLDIAPSERYWNFHGHEGLHHFHDYECAFDETHFQELVICIVHFLNGYMFHLSQFLPNLQRVMLSGIYYQVYNDGLKGPQPYVPDHQTVFTTIVDTSKSSALNSPVEYESIYD